MARLARKVLGGGGAIFLWLKCEPIFETFGAEKKKQVVGKNLGKFSENEIFEIIYIYFFVRDFLLPASTWGHLSPCGLFPSLNALFLVRF